MRKYNAKISDDISIIITVRKRMPRDRNSNDYIFNVYYDVFYEIFARRYFFARKIH